jgi:hypothetical protein
MPEPLRQAPGLRVDTGRKRAKRRLAQPPPFAALRSPCCGARRGSVCGSAAATCSKTVALWLGQHRILHFVSKSVPSRRARELTVLHPAGA